MSNDNHSPRRLNEETKRAIRDRCLLWSDADMPAKHIIALCANYAIRLLEVPADRQADWYELDNTMATPDPYIRLERVNNWGVWYVRLPVGEDVMCRVGEKIPFKDGQSVRIRYPSGTTASVTVAHSQTGTYQVYDGQLYPDNVTSVEPGFWSDVEGVATFVPLHRVEVHADDIPADRVGAST